MLALAIEDIARVCHEANRALQTILREETNPPWEKCDIELQNSAVDGVFNVLDGAGPEQSHGNWLKFKAEHGWTYGPVKDFNKKEHPCFVPYAELPPEQKVKDELFVSIVNALSQDI